MKRIFFLLDEFNGAKESEYLEEDFRE